MDQQKPLFDVVLVMRNEASTISRMVASLRDFQDRGGKIFITDTGSQDDSVAIARSLGCVVTEVGDRFRIQIDDELAQKINEQFVIGGEEPLVKGGDSLFDFASARNFAASQAEQEMISMQDCDEVYTNLDIDEINRKIWEGNKAFVYNFVFSHDQYGNPAIKFHQSKFYSREKQKWVGAVHEVLSGDAVPLFLPEGTLLLEHYQNPLTNRSGYLKGLAYECFMHPEADRNSHYLGREMCWTGRPRSAIRELKRHVGMRKWPAERSQSLVFIGDSYRNLGQEEEAVTAYQEAYSIEGKRREPLIRLAEYYRTKDDYQHTAAYANASLTIPSSDFYANDKSHYAQTPHELLYWSLFWLGDRDGAKTHFLKCLEYQPLREKYLYEARYFLDLPKITVILPHRPGWSERRDLGLQACLDSIKHQNYPQELVETIVVTEGETAPKKVQAGYEQSTGSYIVFAADDMTFHQDAFILAYLDSWKNDKALVSFNSGELTPDEGNINEHFLIRKDFVPQIGQIFDTRFHHCSVDNLLWAKAKKLNEAVRSEHAKINHDHFTKGAEFDSSYQESWSHVEEDRKLLEEELKKL